MLTKLQAYSSWLSATALLLDNDGREETDLIQIRNIEGLDPVKASVNTSPYGSVDGTSFTGARVDTRNIVLTIHPNPDWADWTYESIRKLLYTYFMPKSLVRLVFYSDDISPVEIYGYVEDFSAVQFSKDPEYQISIICPDPYFTSVDPIIVVVNTSDGIPPGIIDYTGDIETGINVVVDYVDGIAPTYIKVITGPSFFKVPTTVGATQRFNLNSTPGSKYVRTVNATDGLISNLLWTVESGSVWPLLQPGKNDFAVVTDVPSHQSCQLTYFSRYGGL